MFEKMIVLFILFAALILYDLPEWKQSTRRDKWIYCGFILPTLYLSLDYVTDSDWVTLHDVAHYLFREPAKAIVEGLKVTS